MIRVRIRFALAWMSLGLCLAPAALPAAEAPALPPKGLVLHFSFDQNDPAGAIPDLSGKNNHGKRTGGWWVQSGRLGGASETGAKSGFIHVPHSESLNVKQGTFALWFRTTKSDPVWRRLIDKNAGKGFALGLGGDILGMYTRGKPAFSVNGSPLCHGDVFVADGAWHHVAGTYDGENLRLYVDGTPQKQVVPLHGEIAANTDDLTIGMNRINPAPEEKNLSFEGAVDEVMIFNRALSAQEIKAMVVAVDPLAGKPRFTKQQVVGRLRQLKLLFEDGLLTEEFYARKVDECHAYQQEMAAPK